MSVIVRAIFNSVEARLWLDVQYFCVIAPVAADLKDSVAFQLNTVLAEVLSLRITTVPAVKIFFVAFLSSVARLKYRNMLLVFGSVPDIDRAKVVSSFILRMHKVGRLE